ncbi:hypothetical protein BSNK01_29360 [Bacillaceae bacterium]
MKFSRFVAGADAAIRSGGVTAFSSNRYVPPDHDVAVRDLILKAAEGKERRYKSEYFDEGSEKEA